MHNSSCAVLVLLLAACFSFAKEEGFWVSGTVESVHDGDTFKMKPQNSKNNQNKTLKIRMFGVDAPEINQEYGKESGNALRNLINGKEIRLYIHNTDRYGRSVGEAWLGDSINVSLWMIQNGNGWWYKSYAKKRTDLESAEKLAKEKKLGFWANENPVPPWDFRKKKK
ncbi:putative endonuclease [Fibrobacterales bacterium]|nr:putative endonuclease [Fibrobacterales bacterium]